MFGAVFMATDYSTSPKGGVAVLIYGVGLGLLTVIIRKFGSMNEGVSYAILLMNIVTPLLDRIRPRPFGTPRVRLSDKWLAWKRNRARKKESAAEGGESVA